MLPLELNTAIFFAKIEFFSIANIMTIFGKRLKKKRPAIAHFQCGLGRYVDSGGHVDFCSHNRYGRIDKYIGRKIDRRHNGLEMREKVSFRISEKYI